MKISKTLVITFLILCIVLLAFSIQGNIEKQELKKQIVQLETDCTLLKERVDKEKDLISIDSLLVKGEYKTALNAYEKQFSDSVRNEDKDYVNFRIKIAKQFVDLEEKTPIKSSLGKSLVEEKQTKKTDDSLENGKDYDSLHSELKNVKKQLYNVKNQLDKKSYLKYLKFKNSKKHVLHYVGETRKKKANGYGVAVFDTGGRYEGEWRNNKREGKGEFYWVDGEYYKGSYKNDFRNGVGTYYWTNGKKYIGDWKNDERHGEGVFYSKKGKILAKGIWKKDKLIKEIE